MWPPPPPPPWPPVASCSTLHPIQDDGAGLQGHRWSCHCLPLNTGQTTHPSVSTSSSTSTTSAGGLVLPPLRANKARSARSQLFSALAPQWWNEVPTNVRTAESLGIFCKGLEDHLFRQICSDPNNNPLTLTHHFTFPTTTTLRYLTWP